MDPIINIATRAARKAGQLIMRATDELNSVSVDKKARNDFVTEVDRQSEREIIYHIKKAYPDHAILAEESGQQEAENNSDYQWVIDPLDGTANFIHGIPHFAISIAVKVKGRVEYGLIYDPVRDELFTAIRGKGAFFNNRRIRMPAKAKMDNALLATGFPFRHREYFDAHLKTFTELYSQVSDIRRQGSAALDLAYVAANRYDGYWELKLSEWDIAAGALMVKEAGGMVSDFNGGEDYLQSGNIIAASARIFKPMLQVIKPVLGKN